MNEKVRSFSTWRSDFRLLRLVVYQDYRKAWWSNRGLPVRLGNRYRQGFLSPLNLKRDSRRKGFHSYLPIRTTKAQDQARFRD